MSFYALFVVIIILVFIFNHMWYKFACIQFLYYNSNKHTLIIAKFKILPMHTEACDVRDLDHTPMSQLTELHLRKLEGHFLFYAYI